MEYNSHWLVSLNDSGHQMKFMLHWVIKGDKIKNR